MKNFTNLFNIICLLLIPVLQTFAADGPAVEKRKTYTKSYNISGNDRITLDNKFGEVKINTWTKNEVKVDVTIITSSSTEERAQQLLDLVSIEDGKNANGVYFRTERKKDAKKSGSKNEDSKTNYQVYLPAGNPLKISNQFGATIIPDINGQLELDSKFGSLKAGKLNNVKELSVEFGTAEIESIKGNELNIKFSRAIINNVEGNIKARFEHCSGIKLGLENAVKGLNISNSFTSLFLDVDKNLSADFNINTSFGNFSNSTAFNIPEVSSEQNNKPGKTKHNYSGKAGKGGADIKINSEFGKIVLGHNLEMDLKENKQTSKETKKSTKENKKTTTRI